MVASRNCDKAGLWNARLCTCSNNNTTLPLVQLRPRYIGRGDYRKIERLRFTSESRWSSYGSRARDLDSPVRVDGAVMGPEQGT